MSIADRLGKNGIFLSNEAREQLNIKLSPEEFERLKEQINKDHDPDEVKKCFLTNNYVKVKDGLSLDPEWVASAIEKNIESQDKLWEKFKKDNLVVCSNCGASVEAKKRHFQCPKCNHEIDSKKYKKSIKLPYAKKVSMRLYVKYLRGKVL